MTDRDFLGAYRSLDTALQKETLSPDAVARLDQALEKAQGGGNKRRLWVASAFVAAAACLVVAVILARPQPERSTRVGGFALSERTPDLSVHTAEDGTVVIEGGGCTLHEPAEAITARVDGLARLKREPQGVRVVRGRVEFQVAKRPSKSSPARVLVSGGAIEILGTRFRVDQDDTGGTVMLFEGSIQFRAPDGRVLPLAPGQTLRWPVVAAAPTPELAPAPVPAPKRHPRPTTVREPQPPQVEALLHRLAGLRTRGEYDTAIRELRVALGRSLPESSRELLEYELGSLLTYQLADPQRACEHWTRFTRRFKSGRYAAEVQAAQETMRCRLKR